MRLRVVFVVFAALACFSCWFQFQPVPASLVPLVDVLFFGSGAAVLAIGATLLMRRAQSSTSIE